MINGCKKDDDINQTGQSTSPNLNIRGGLAFRVVDGSSNPMAGVTISLALSQTELNNGTYLSTKITDANGRADFGLLNSGNYYYRADVTINSVAYHGEGVVQVQAGENLTQELTLD
jgi:5-hydroxyisourate hydrolase-like protein (transthyretin family)